MPPHHEKKPNWQARAAIIAAIAGLLGAGTPITMKILEMVDRWITIDKMAKYGYTIPTDTNVIEVKTNGQPR